MTGDDVDYILEGINKYLMALAEKQIKLALNNHKKKPLIFTKEQKRALRRRKETINK